MCQRYVNRHLNILVTKLTFDLRIHCIKWISFEGQYGNNILHCAAMKGRYDLMDFLLTKCSMCSSLLPNEKNDRSETPLHLAAGYHTKGSRYLMNSYTIDISKKFHCSPIPNEAFRVQKIWQYLLAHKLSLLGICFQKMITIGQLYYVFWMLELTLMPEQIGVTQQPIMLPFMGLTKCWNFYVKKGFLSTNPKNVCHIISFQTYIGINDNCII